jgi:hypothetical protein
MSLLTANSDSRRACGENCRIACMHGTQDETRMVAQRWDRPSSGFFDTEHQLSLNLYFLSTSLMATGNSDHIIEAVDKG